MLLLVYFLDDSSPEPRVQSELPRRVPELLFYDTSGANSRASGEDFATVTFDRYARRATRASVLNKAEELLNQRRHTREMESIAESHIAIYNARNRLRSKIHHHNNNNSNHNKRRNKHLDPNNNDLQHHHNDNKFYNKNGQKFQYKNSRNERNHGNNRRVAFVTENLTDEAEEYDEFSDANETYSKALSSYKSSFRSLSSYKSGSSVLGIVRSNSKDMLRRNRLQQLNARMKSGQSGHGRRMHKKSRRVAMMSRVPRRRVSGNLSVIYLYRGYSIRT